MSPNSRKHHGLAAPEASSSSLRMNVARQDNAQTSKTLLVSQVASAFASDGQDPPVTGQVLSLTSSNNFINFCSTTNLQLTNGQQVAAGSCNPTPMGELAGSNNMPSTKFTVPKNGDVIAENSPFTITVASNNMNTGNWNNPSSSYLAAPQHISAGGIDGHYAIVVEELSSFDQGTLLDPSKFTFFKEVIGTNITADVAGLPAGFYRATATAHASNHQVVLASVAQHGYFHDAIYFTVVGSGQNRKREIAELSRDYTYPNPDPKYRAARQMASEPLRRSRRLFHARQTDQTSLTLSESVICPGFANDGQGSSPPTGQTASLTSTNNFINFCATLPSTPITNGQQIRSGSCNPAPMGLIPATTNIPSSRFTFPTFNTTIKVNAPFTVTLAVNNLETGNFASSITNFMAAPQQLNTQGVVKGYSSVVIEAVASMIDTEPSDPTAFAFFRSMNTPAVGNQISGAVTGGLPAGIYRMSSILRATNHQPIVLPIIQHGAIDDVVYFSVSEDGIVPPPPSTVTTSLPASTKATSSTPTGSATSSQTPLPSSSNSPNSNSQQSSTKSSTTGIAVGVTLGVVALLLLLLGLLWWRKRRERQRLAEAYVDNFTPFPPSASDQAGTTYMSPSMNTSGPVSTVNGGMFVTQFDHGGALFYGASPAQTDKLQPVRANRSSVSSAAPSYHTVFSPTRS